MRLRAGAVTGALARLSRGHSRRALHELPAEGEARREFRYDPAFEVTGLVTAAELDEQVASFRTWPSDAGPYTFVTADPLVMRVREGGRVVIVHALLATGVNADGHREILGIRGWSCRLPRPHKATEQTVVPLRRQVGRGREASDVPRG